MLKNTEGKEVDAFEQEMEYRIANISAAINNEPNLPFIEHLKGQQQAFRYALEIYRECRGDVQ